MSYFQEGDSNHSHFFHFIGKFLAEGACTATEAEPMLSIVKTISPGSYQLLHIIELMLSKNDTLFYVSFE